MNTALTDLHGLNILVTRPKELTKNLAQLIEREGGKAVLYPVITIEDINTAGISDKILNRLSSFDIAIFISPTAVSKTFETIESLPSTLKVAAIGSSTESALTKHNVVVSIKTDGHTSEALLCHEQFQDKQIRGKSIVIFRGVGGREQLGNTLISRGGKISYAEMYKRVRPQNMASITDNKLNAVNIITVTSNEGLQNLFDLTINKSLLTQKPLLVPGSRCKKLAETLGFSNITQSDNATDAACINALKSWAGAQKTAD